MQQLKEWFLNQKRDLPWRRDRTPYRIWISEVMLQQTQVAVVIPYFHRWMQKFPTLESLAHALEEEVIKLWEGLGYYSRARNLHKAARLILEKHQGIIPSQAQELEELPGFGPYTVGALLSFAFQQKAPAVDGNVVRVTSRYFASSEDCSKKAHYEKLTHSLLPDEDPWIVMEALIELGARICQKKPKCLECPILEGCQAYRQGRTLEFPVSRKRPAIIQLKRHVGIIQTGNKILVRQEKEKKLMSGLYEFPYTTDADPFPFQGILRKIVDFPVVKHGFTRYNVSLFPTLYQIDTEIPIHGYEWRVQETLKQLPFSAGHRRILEIMDAYFTH